MRAVVFSQAGCRCSSCCVGWRLPRIRACTVAPVVVLGREIYMAMRKSSAPGSYPRRAGRCVLECHGDAQVVMSLNIATGSGCPVNVQIQQCGDKSRLRAKHQHQATKKPGSPGGTAVTTAATVAATPSMSENTGTGIMAGANAKRPAATLLPVGAKKSKYNGVPPVGSHEERPVPTAAPAGHEHPEGSMLPCCPVLEFLLKLTVG